MATGTLPPGVPATHPAVVTVGPRKPLEIMTRPTELPGPDEVLVHVEWTSSTPLDLHQADGGLLIQHPFVMGSTYGGTVAALGDNVKNSDRSDKHTLHVGDTVFGFTFLAARDHTFQTYATVYAHLCSRLPPSLTLPAAVTVSVNLVTAFHSLTADLGLDLPWPMPSEVPAWRPPNVETPILIWGASSSVGQYALQVLRHWRYQNVLAVASSRHHEELRRLGARACFDYHSPDVHEQIAAHVGVGAGSGPKVPFILDCIGSLEGSLRPLTRIAGPGTIVAVMLPVIKVHASEERTPEYEMDVTKCLVGEWQEGVVLKGVRTHHYMQNKFFKDHLQPEIVPTLLEQGIIEPNKQRIVEGKTLLERAEAALALLREQAPSGEKLVWRVADE